MKSSLMKGAARVKALPFVGFFVVAVLVLAPTQSSGKLRMGLSGVAGAGFFVANDDALYPDSLIADYHNDVVTVSLYPELGIQADVSALRFGAKVGYISITNDYEYEWYDGYNYWYEYDQYTRAYIPIQAEVLLAPLDLFMYQPILSPYVGVGVGAFLAAGDNDDNRTAFTFKLGMEFLANPVIAYADFRYLYAPKEAEHMWEQDTNAGGFAMVVGFGLRLGTSD